MTTEPIPDKVELFDHCKENAVPAGLRDRLEVYWARTLERIKKVCEADDSIESHRE
jgi:hypothetical protein